MYNYIFQNVGISLFYKKKIIYLSEIFMNDFTLLLFLDNNIFNLKTL